MTKEEAKLVLLLGGTVECRNRANWHTVTKEGIGYKVSSLYGKSYYTTTTDYWKSCTNPNYGTGWEVVTEKS